MWYQMCGHLELFLGKLKMLRESVLNKNDPDPLEGVDRNLKEAHQNMLREKEALGGVATTLT